MLCAASAAFAGADEPRALWGKIFDSATAAGDQCQANAIATDGCVYWHLTGGSTHAERNISYDGRLLFEGSDMDAGSTTQNNNLCVMKTDPAGNVVWKLYSTSCDYANNQGSVAATSDGGVVFSAKLRSTEDDGTGAMLFSDVTLVDGKGDTHSFKWQHTDADARRFYRLMVGRISADGTLRWVRFISADRAIPANNIDFAADCISTTNLAVAADEADNIYIGGNFRSRVTIDGTETVLTPHNTTGWSGDAQASVGDMFILKFSADGSYASHAVTTVEQGSATSESVNELIWADGALYVQALFLADGCRFSLGGKSFTTSGDFSPVLMRLDGNLAASWITPLKGEKISGKYGFQNCGINKVNDVVWFTGMYDGVVSYDAAHSFSSEPSTPSVREGFLARFDASTGAMTAGVSSRDSYPTSLGAPYKALCGYFKAIQNPVEPDYVYVYGYAMNAPLGVFLRAYDARTLKSDPASEWCLVKGGQMPSCQSIAYEPSTARIYTAVRGRQTPFELIGGITAAQPNTTWSILLAGFLMPDSFLQTGMVSTVITDGIEVSGAGGVLKVVNGSDRAVNVDVYDLMGRCVSRLQAAPGITTHQLGHGIYIAAGRKIML